MFAVGGFDLGADYATYSGMAAFVGLVAAPFVS